jgi:hypothetical protein
VLPLVLHVLPVVPVESKLRHLSSVATR